MNVISALREPPVGTVLLDCYGTRWKRCEEECGMWHCSEHESQEQGLSWFVIYTLGSPVVLLGLE